jgi:hypothetical protein
LNRGFARWRLVACATHKALQGSEGRQWRTEVKEESGGRKGK